MVRAYAEDDFPDQAPSLFHELQVPGIRFYIETVRSILPVVLAEKILIPTLTALVTLAVLPALPSPHLQWNHKLHVYKSSTGQSLGSVRANDVNEVHTLHGMLRLDFDQNVSDVPPSLHEISLKQSTPLSNILHTHPSSPLIPLMFRHSHANEIPCAHPPVHHSHYYPHPAMQRPPPLTLPSTAAGRGSPRERIRVARRWTPAASSVVAACFVTMQPCTSAAGTTVVSVLSPQDGRPPYLQLESHEAGAQGPGLLEKCTHAHVESPMPMGLTWRISSTLGLPLSASRLVYSPG